MKQATIYGWRWLVEVNNHLGPLGYLATLAGVGYASYRLNNWWLFITIALALYLLLFAEGAYAVWREAQQGLPEIFAIICDQTVASLERRRKQGNDWLATLRKVQTNSAQIEAIDTLLDRWLELIYEVLVGFPDVYATFSDEASAPLVSPTDKRTEVFDAVRRRVQQIDAAIKEVERQRDELSRRAR